MVLAFIRALIEQFDDFYREAEKYAVNADGHPTDRAGGSRHTETTPSPEANPLIVLGSKQKVTTIQEVIANQDTAFTSFCSRVSHVIQALSSEQGDTICINDSHQV